MSHAGNGTMNVAFPMKRSERTGSEDRRRKIFADPTDVVLYLAFLMLPVDGTIYGFSMMYWTPIAPILFGAYALLNVWSLPKTVARYGTLLVFPVICVLVSVFGWLTIGFHTNTAVRTLVALATGISCLISLDVAFRIKRLSISAAVTVIAVAYWLSFGVGVLQFVIMHTGDQTIIRFFQFKMERSYVPHHVQFLFAEPSYIGMHLFGVLMPICWLTKRKDVLVLILVYAFGAAAMGAGVRILIDTVVAFVLWIAVVVDFRHKRNRAIAAAGFAAVCVGGAVVLLRNARVQSLLQNGVLTGDASTFARLFRSLAPIEAWLADPLHMLFGFGAGNLKDAIARGYDAASKVIMALGVNPQDSYEIRLLGSLHEDHYIFTMNAYVDFITEFGLVLFIAAIVLIVMHINRNHAWNRMTICWFLLLIYLYIQFEGYAFYALWMFLWFTGLNPNRQGTTGQGRVREKREVFARGRHRSGRKSVR